MRTHVGHLARIACIAALIASCRATISDQTGTNDGGPLESPDPATRADDDDSVAPPVAPERCTPEVCDGLDNDCDGAVDNGCPVAGYDPTPPADDTPDEPDAPMYEVCNGEDDDGDGATDEGCPPPADVSDSDAGDDDSDPSDPEDPAVAWNWRTDDLVALPDRTPAIVRTVLDGYETTDLRAFLVGFVSNPLTDDSRDPFLLLETDPTDERWDATLGPAAAMSGSPVYILEGKAGALSYSIGDTVGPFGFVAMPIEHMLDVDAAPLGDPWAGGLDPLAIAMRVSPAHTAWFNPADAFDERFVTVTADGTSGAAADDEAPPMVPGSAIAVLIMSGDVLNLAGVGTVTAMDGDALWAFGHPMFGAGDVVIPFSNARVDAIAANPAWGSYKISTPTGPLLGTITADRITAIAGRFGAVGGIRTSLTSTYGDATETVAHLVAWYGDPWYAAGNATYSVIWPITIQRERLFGGAGTIAYTVRATVAETDAVAERADVLADEWWPEAEVFYALSDALWTLMSDERTPLTLATLTLTAETFDDLHELTVARVTHASEVAPGNALVLVVELTPHGAGDSEMRGIVLEVPADFPPGDALLTVASEWTLADNTWTWRDPACTAREPSPTPEDLIAQFNAAPRHRALVAQVTSLAMSDQCVCTGDPPVCPCDDPCAPIPEPATVRVVLEEQAYVVGSAKTLITVTGADALATTDDGFFCPECEADGCPPDGCREDAY